MLYDDFQLLKTKEIEVMAKAYANELKKQQSCVFCSENEKADIINKLTFQNLLLFHLSKSPLGRVKLQTIAQARKLTSESINNIYSSLDHPSKSMIKKYLFQPVSLEDTYKTTIIKEIEFIEHLEKCPTPNIRELKNSRILILKNLISIL